MYKEKTIEDKYNISFEDRLELNNIAYKDVIYEYINLFCKKQKCDLEFNTGDILCFGDNYFSLDDVIFDLNNNCKKGLIFKWQNDGINAYMQYSDLPNINYNSYNMGMRYKTLIKQYLKKLKLNSGYKKEKESNKKS
jgi:hypothetical protein